MSDSSPPGTNIPNHVAIIMDGNRRWAKARNMPVLAGHNQVVSKILKPLITRAQQLGIKFLTLWAFSTENWQRDRREVQGLLSIFRDVLKSEIAEANQKGIRIKVIGDVSVFPQDIQEGIKKGMATTAQNKAMTVNFALNYGGRDEITRAVKKILRYQDTKILSVNLTEEKFSEFLDTTDMPDPDLIIRTGGEMRFSGFMSWQSAYSELYFTQVLMPDFTPQEFDKAIIDFQQRQRRFGK